MLILLPYMFAIKFLDICVRTCWSDETGSLTIQMVTSGSLP